MKDRTILTLFAVIVLLLIFFLTSFDEQVQNVFGFNKTELKFKTGTAKAAPKCRLSAVCPKDHFPFKIWSGAANVVGPKICFNGKNVMSHILNNVGPGLNIVVVNDETGVVERFDYLNMISGNSADILTYLEKIKPGMIVLVASFDDAATKMTDEIRQMFVDMGSTLIRSVKHRDNWVFAGRAGIKIKSIFEQRAENDEITNVFDGWPEMVQVGGCFPMTKSV
ncbi:PREDICTED: protein FAM3C-like [Cyprinodon variegatus]|uniref:protein FAM3C-like n=1 Tax=Cyprinodon variegatus TaxID=28743 RepID=UPI0007429524|nr:PREDICTED: protein FAM3C-like [Cyprinodon variegatus]